MRIANPIGKKGEDIAVEYLKKKGYEILERNYRKQYAEIDIVALQPIQQVHGKQVQGKLKKEGILVFIEVKTRTSFEFGSPLEAITPWKLRPLIKLAQYYQLTHPALPEEMRIDAIAVGLFELGGTPRIEHVENISGF